ncbi:hypothetical protein PUNSTDRAFT_122540 [Punctularia strigosozonata HHB-11173 SS5]|uniref:RING-CH-type domain-containing protein n=1 Tax=Punctularia strigosozonata (strain HHB-11173) TaxID=741275 RepID=R7S5Y8_PUNST|nr:uncharacterized protein PUNSTDRAFT_122540 [Punctularia strigosozonata HHB-11173 SS5]EIN05291.1 hypothetical protein PUNSTDRAFT_122540 [Punctularia strigosozonata HHB-11173 SS5]
MPAPTIDDLRVKQCYICSDEETYDHPQTPPRAWVHPCNCTLIAHESCLLEWIKSSQGDKERSKNALKCPQCGATYEMESDNRLSLRILNIVNKTVSNICGGVAIVTVLSTVGGCFYVICTAYGSWAVEQFLGREMYDILLTDDPSNWPWHAFLNLPLIPLSLLISRTPLFDALQVPATPFFLAWPTSSPVVETTQQRFSAHFSASPSSPLPISPSMPSFPGSLFRYPPSPLLMLIFIPVIRKLYNRSLNRLRNWALGTKPSIQRPVRRVVWDFGQMPLPLRIRVVANVAGAEDAPNNNNRQANANDAEQPNANPIPNADNNNVNADENADPNNANALAAERAVDLTHLSLGRTLIETLSLPWIANRAGRALARLAVYFPLLRRILAIRQPRWHGGAVPPPLGAASYPAFWAGMSEARRVWTAVKVGLGLVWGGSAAWAESDPVWWRNAIGLGLYIAAKDCIDLYHLWLTKRELETRRLKTRPFVGIDVGELDLVSREERENRLNSVLL